MPCRIQLILPSSKTSRNQPQSAAISRNVLGFIYVLTRLVIGVALLYAGASKILSDQSMLVGGHWIVPAAFVVMIGVLECVVGWMVIAFIPSRGLLAVVVCMFTVFLGVLALQAYSGLHRCSCLGSSGLPVTTVMCFDIAVVCSCVLFRDRWCYPIELSDGMARDLIGGLKIAVPVALVAAVLWFGSLEAASDFLAGSAVRVIAREQFLGSVEPDTEISAVFTVRNPGSQTIKILGAKSSCRCYAAKDLPIELAPGEEKQVGMTLYSGSLAGPQRESALLIFDSSAPGIVLGTTVLVHPGRVDKDAKSQLEKF